MRTRHSLPVESSLGPAIAGSARCHDPPNLGTILSYECQDPSERLASVSASPSVLALSPDEALHIRGCREEPVRALVVHDLQVEPTADLPGSFTVNAPLHKLHGVGILGTEQFDPLFRCQSDETRITGLERELALGNLEMFMAVQALDLHPRQG
jgi:hypothetical protein